MLFFCSSRSSLTPLAGSECLDKAYFPLARLVNKHGAHYICSKKGSVSSFYLVYLFAIDCSPVELDTDTCMWCIIDIFLNETLRSFVIYSWGIRPVHLCAFDPLLET